MSWRTIRDAVVTVLGVVLLVALAVGVVVVAFMAVANGG
jgi:flagellar biosynthesis protein FliQ